MNLRQFLEPVFQRYHQAKFLGSDPLEFVHRFSDAEDQEIVGVFASVLAYGNVKQIRASVEDLLGRIDRLSAQRGPHAWVSALSNQESLQEAREILAGFKHRFQVGEDVLLLARVMNRSLQRHGGIGLHFASYFRKEDSTIERALDHFLGDWKSWASELEPARATLLSFQHLLSRPMDGSTCKRWLMYLRWMVRSDALDLGIWQVYGVLPRHLILPLDTHTGRISQYLRLTDRRSLNWKAAQEITSRLMHADPEDPVKYDFALSRLGILSLCQKRYRAEVCESCELLNGCRFAQKNQKKKGKLK